MEILYVHDYWVSFHLILVFARNLLGVICQVTSLLTVHFLISKSCNCNFMLVPFYLPCLLYFSMTNTLVRVYLGLLFFIRDCGNYHTALPSPYFVAFKCVLLLHFQSTFFMFLLFFLFSGCFGFDCIYEDVFLKVQLFLGLKCLALIF